MHRYTKAWLAFAGGLALGTFVAVGSWFGAGPGDQGEVTVRWTVNGSNDSVACKRGGGLRVELRRIDARGRADVVKRLQCEEFSDRVQWDEGWYQAELRLLDEADHLVAQVATTGPFDVRRARQAILSVDFPRGDRAAATLSFAR